MMMMQCLIANISVDMPVLAVKKISLTFMGKKLSLCHGVKCLTEIQVNELQELVKVLVKCYQ